MKLKKDQLDWLRMMTHNNFIVPERENQKDEKEEKNDNEIKPALHTNGSTGGERRLRGEKRREEDEEEERGRGRESE